MRRFGVNEMTVDSPWNTSLVLGRTPKVVIENNLFQAPFPALTKEMALAVWLPHISAIISNLSRLQFNTQQFTFQSYSPRHAGHNQIAYLSFQSVFNL